MLFLLLSLFLAGLVVGALGRLVVPGPNPMGILRTALVGVGGSFLGGLVGRLVFGLRYRYSFGLGLVLSVAFAALIVYFLDPRRHRRGRAF
ncbi:MAG: GlsB/YeaQ/YmgE family stress response membrane protein [Acidimicrobiales bacterium]